MSVKDELRELRDNLLSSLRTWLSVKIMLEDTDGIKDFTKYVNRYTASEVMFLIEEHGFKDDLEPIIDKIQSSTPLQSMGETET